MNSFNMGKEEPINLRIPAPQVEEDKLHLTSAEEERLAKIMKKSKLENIENELTVPVPISKSEKKRLARQQVQILMQDKFKAFQFCWIIRINDIL